METILKPNLNNVVSLLQVIHVYRISTHITLLMMLIMRLSGSTVDIVVPITRKYHYTACCAERKASKTLASFVASRRRRYLVGVTVI